MTHSSRKVLRFDQWIDRSFDRILGAAPGVALEVAPIADGVASNRARLASATIYQISSVRDEVPPALQVTAELLGHCPQLLCVSTTGAGYDTVDVQACSRAGVLVVNQAGANANSVAEHALCLILAVSRRIGECAWRMRHDTGYAREDLMGHELLGKTLGIVGLGNIGGRAAGMAAAFGMRVLAYDPYLDADVISARGAEKATWAQLLAASDVISVHCPLTAETRNMFDAAAYGAMKPGALFVSTARGGIHDEDALHAALVAGHLAGAGLDVWAVEPPEHAHPLLALHNVIPTYHIAGVTHEARRNVATMAAEQIVSMLAGQRPPRMINPQVWPRVLERLNSPEPR
ncbi:MAG: hydroxyacid dehydrogenase [Burkholderiaceae bacterium]|uniref:hydroxyacid dehydrogenase n=1 Tax=Castellaniella sp. TaxID=1955812 RepID=UPI00355E660F